jgi:biopolymer transport protein ExbD
MKFERRLTKKAKVDMTPLVDVLFMLLLFFMLTSVFKMVPGISMKLPTSTTNQTVSLSRLQVVAVSESEIYVNSTKTGIDGLDAAIKAAIAGKKPSDFSATFQGDKTAPYQLVVSVLDALRMNGIEGVSLITSASGKKP